MRILHVGSGFRPWRRGGLVAYVEELTTAQARLGHEVTYFLSGRMYPFLSGPRLRRWERDGVCHLEVVNSPLYDHGRQPALEADEPRLERMFERVVEQRRPDVIHFQELAGLPWSLIEIADRLGVPNVVTLQDYFALCPTFKLLDHAGEVCLRREIGADCVATTAADERDPHILFEATIGLTLAKRELLTSLPEERRVALMRGVSRAVTKATVRAREADRSPEAFQRRRDRNVESLGRADRVVAMSARVAEIHEQLGVDPRRMTNMQLTLGVIDGLKPRASRSDGAPLTFATLGALESTAKGAQVFLAAIRKLGRAVPPERFRVLVFGFVDPAFERDAAALPGVTLRGPYWPADLDGLLDEVDVGLMPSIWEEAYGYAGVEFLAKGIPVIANAIGGMPEYTREGETGWLNRSRSATELASIMQRLVESPEEVAELRTRVVDGRDRIVKPHAVHVAEMHELYETVIAERAAASAERAA